MTYNRTTLLNRYYDDYGEYPDSLQQVITLYDTDEIPESLRGFIVGIYYDPFCKDSSLLRYYPLKVNGENMDYILYSIGPNNIDDNQELIMNFDELDNRNLYFKGNYQEYNKIFLLPNSLDILLKYPSHSFYSERFDTI